MSSGRRRRRAEQVCQNRLSSSPCKRILRAGILLAFVVLCLGLSTNANAVKRQDGEMPTKVSDDESSLSEMSMPGPVPVDVAKEHVTMEMPQPKKLTDEQRQVKEVMKAGMPSLFRDSAPWGDSLAEQAGLQLTTPTSDAALLKKPEDGEESTLDEVSDNSKDRRPMPKLSSLADTDVATGAAPADATPAVNATEGVTAITPVVTNASAPAAPADQGQPQMMQPPAPAQPADQPQPVAAPVTAPTNATAMPVNVTVQPTNTTTSTLQNQTAPAQNTTQGPQPVPVTNITTQPVNATTPPPANTTTPPPAPTPPQNATQGRPPNRNPFAPQNPNQPFRGNPFNPFAPPGQPGQPGQSPPPGQPGQFGQGDLRAAQNAQQAQNTSQKPTSNCPNVDMRIPWSAASPGQRTAYLSAIRCMTTIKGRWDGSRDGNPSHSMYEDWVLWHNYMQPLIHRNAALLPCHRLFVNVWFAQLKSQCGYGGPLLYMDWWTYGDRNQIWTSPDIWGNNYGNADGMVRQGVFAGVRVNYSASYFNSRNVQRVSRPICRQYRTISSNGIPYVSYMTSNFVRSLLRETNYDSFRRQLEDTFHQYLHVSIGCDLVPTSSPNCPTFFAIHSAVDYVWAVWQEINGGANRFKYNGPHGEMDFSQASPTDTCTMLGMWSVDFNVQDLLDINSKPNCYTYQWSPSLGPS